MLRRVTTPAALFVRHRTGFRGAVNCTNAVRGMPNNRCGDSGHVLLGSSARGGARSWIRSPIRSGKCLESISNASVLGPLEIGGLEKPLKGFPLAEKPTVWHRRPLFLRGIAAPRFNGEDFERNLREERTCQVVWWAVKDSNLRPKD